MSRAVPMATATVATLPGSGEPRMIEHATAPEMAQTAPTERSMPRVAMTSVMPTAMIRVGRAVAQDVDEAAEEVAVADLNGEEAGEGDQVDDEQRRRASRSARTAGVEQ